MDYYYVTKDDTLFSIADMYQIAVNELLDANNLNENSVIQVGQRLIIPTYRRDIYDRYVVKAGDTIYSLAKKYNMEPGLLMQINGMESGTELRAGMTLLVPKEGFSFVITKNGDTLRGVAKDLNTTVEQLLYSNVAIYLLPDQLIVYQDLQKS